MQASRSGLCRSIRPQVSQAERDGLEGRDTHGVIVLERCDQQPLAVPGFEGLQPAGERIDEPQMRYAFPGMDRAFLVQVEFAGSGREHLAHPVGREGREKLYSVRAGVRYSGW